MTGPASDPRVAHLRLDGGPLSAATAESLTAQATELREQRDVRVIVLDARMSPFCTGPAEDLDPLAVHPAGIDPAAAIAALRPPVVCVIEGSCTSVGLELALAADVRIASTGASFAIPDVADGRLPCWGATQRLSRAVRPAVATSMILTGRSLDAGEARSLGLVHDVADDPAAVADAMVETLLGLGPLALELAKEAVHRGAELPLRDGLRLEGDLNHQLAATEDRAEGLAAFFDKRPPDFSGR